jgi:hypothetical protein
MTEAINVHEWLSLLEREYLDGYVAAGGATIKFAVPLDPVAAAALRDRLGRYASREEYLCLSVDAGATRIHLVQDVFTRLADQVPWQALARRVNAAIASELGYALPDEHADGFLDALAVRNGTDAKAIRVRFNPRLTDSVYRNYDLARDFRVAMLQLCEADLSGGEEGRLRGERITAWLTGRNKHISAVKEFQIFSRITRTNGRVFMESLFAWVRCTGLRGTIVLLDLTQLAAARREPDGRLFYATAALLDAYEVLRQFIDAMDHLTGCLMVAIPAPPFLDLEPGGRGLGRYEALKFRVYDEVRAKEHANPLAALVRLESTGGSQENTL